MAEQKGARLSAPVRAPQLQLAPEQPSAGECWIPPKEQNAPCPRTKEEPQQDGRRGEIMFTAEPYTHQRYSEGSNKAWAHQDTETEPDQPLKCLNVPSGGKGQQWPAAGRGTLAAADLGHAACGMSPLRGGLH